MAPSAVYIQENSDLHANISNPTNNTNSQASNGSHALIEHALQTRVDDIDDDNCDAGAEDAFFVADLGELRRQHQRWRLNLPRVQPHYAVKCNPDGQVLKLLSGLGTGFDCASKAEIEQVLSMGVDPSRIIYAQPCKTKSHLRYASSSGVSQMTFDNADELYKIHALCPAAQLFLRIATDDSASLCRLSLKFGASLDTTRELLELAKRLQLHVVGVAFHVGSGASDPKAFLKAVQDSWTVFEQATELGFHMHTLDVGGGFCTENFEQMASVLSNALDLYFPPSIRIIAEPGRYYVSSAFTLACHVIARRTVTDPTLGTISYMLYLNDGVYGNFSSIIFDHQQPIPRLLKCGNRFLYSVCKSTGGFETPSAIEYSIWGPTCDGIDCISQSCFFPNVVDIGDWLYFEDMGAYTRCSATAFNGFTNQHDVIYVDIDR